MRMAREFGKMSWEDVGNLRKAMSKSLGKEFFDKYGKQFIKGSVENGFTESKAQDLWDSICNFGSWSFNRSHAVAYGTVSYWCCVLKAHFPLEYAAACLRHNKDDDQQIRLLRELVSEGFKYKPFDKDKSVENWSVQDGVIIGGLLGVNGIGAKTAKDIMDRRNAGKTLTPAQQKKLDSAKTPYDDIFEAQTKWGHILADPTAHGFASRITPIKELTMDSEGTFVIIAKLKEKKLRDHNELIEIKKRGGKEMTGQTLFLNLTVEDDTETINCGIDRFKYLKYGKPIIEEGKNGDWYAFKGKMRKGFRKLYIDRWKKLSG
jgi:hypothetical protein